jgi:hypothetical protein
VLLGHRLLEQVGGPAVDLQFGLEFGDPAAGLAQVCQVGGRHPGHPAGVDRFLPAPHIDGLTADLQVVRELRKGPTGLQ